MSPDSSVWNLNQAFQGALCSGMPLSSCPIWGTGKQALVILELYFQGWWSNSSGSKEQQDPWGPKVGTLGTCVIYMRKLGVQRDSGIAYSLNPTQA